MVYLLPRTLFYKPRRLHYQSFSKRMLQQALLYTWGSFQLFEERPKNLWKKVPNQMLWSAFCPLEKFLKKLLFRLSLYFLSFQILVLFAQFSGFPAQLHEVHHFVAAAPLPFHPDFCSFGHAIVRWNFQFPWRNTSFEFQLLFHCHAHRLSGQFFFYFSHHFSELIFSTLLELPFLSSFISIIIV